MHVFLGEVSRLVCYCGDTLPVWTCQLGFVETVSCLLVLEAVILADFID